jgi:hypothetical protein
MKRAVVRAKIDRQPNTLRLEHFPSKPILPEQRMAGSRHSSGRARGEPYFREHPPLPLNKMTAV